MSSVYDNWERLVAATLKRDQLRLIALADSFSSSSSSSISADFSSRFSFDSLLLPDVNEIIDFATPPSSRAIAFKELKMATNSFRSDLILGEGGFGHVYKGWIHYPTLIAAEPESGMAVAVKKLKQEIFQGRPEWLGEINYLTQLHHPNLVKLIGYCSEEDKLLLVYEFMQNGSLDNHLFRKAHQSLSWALRIKVAIGAARGLTFLHDMEKQVIHRNIIAANILLDETFNVKLSGFGLALNGPTGDMTHVSTQVMGTYGYAAPEYVRTGRITAKCDVYSFGAVLLELLCGRRVLDFNRVPKERNLVDLAKPYMSDKRKLHRIMDTKLKGQYPKKGAYRAATLALQCLNPMPKERPRMAEVLIVLEHL